MICLTGDIHHAALNTGNQQHCDISEIQVAQRYMKMLEEADVKVTFFISGKCFQDEWDDIRPICEHPLVETGGHTWDCYEPWLWHRISKKLFGSFNGPAWYQRRDMLKTRDIIKQKTGQHINLWRNHMYMHGPNTDRLLAEEGFIMCSDGAKKDAMGPTWNSAGLYDFPINVIPDHEHLYHAERTPEWVDWWVKRYNWSDDYGTKSYYVEEWTDIVLDCLRRNEKRGAISNLIIHPITLYLCDELKSFQRILDFLADHETVHISDVIPAKGAN